MLGQRFPEVAGVSGQIVFVAPADLPGASSLGVRLGGSRFANKSVEVTWAEGLGVLVALVVLVNALIGSKYLNPEMLVRRRSVDLS